MSRKIRSRMNTYSSLHMYRIGRVCARRREGNGRWVVVVWVIVQLVAMLERVARRGRAVGARVHGALMVAVLLLVCNVDVRHAVRVKKAQSSSRSRQVSTTGQVSREAVVGTSDSVCGTMFVVSLGMRELSLYLQREMGGEERIHDARPRG